LRQSIRSSPHIRGLDTTGYPKSTVLTMPFNGCFDYGRGPFIKASNMMAPQELLYPARNYYGTETNRTSILVTCILLHKLVAGYDCKNRHEINIKLWRSLTLVLLQSPAFTLKILLVTLRSSNNYAAVQIGNIACQQATATLLKSYEELLRCSLKTIFVFVYTSNSNSPL
jgi:hypothetical protein